MAKMYYTTHKDDSNIPEGKAVISMNNNGWIGTNNGYPHNGQPALFPEQQAKAIVHAFDFMLFLFSEEKAKEMMPHPETVDQKVWDWIYSNNSMTG